MTHSESLNQTLKRFQSMIKQVEKRFAERERFTGKNTYSCLKEDEDGALQRSVSRPNDYEAAKRQLDEQQ